MNVRSDKYINNKIEIPHPKRIVLYQLEMYPYTDYDMTRLIENQDYNRIIVRAQDLDDDGKIRLLMGLIRFGKIIGFQKIFNALGYTDYSLHNSIFLRTVVFCDDEKKACEMAKYFLEHGCDVSAMDNMCLKMAAQFLDKFDLKKLLLEYGADIHAENDYVFRLACFNGARSIENIKFWLDHGADIHADDDYGLQITTHYCYHDTMIFLIDHGADFIKHSNYILRECLNNDIDGTALKKIFELGVDISIVRPTDVILSICNQNIAVLSVLAEYGYNFKMLNNWNNDKYDDIFKFLKEQGMDDLEIAMLLLR